MNTFLVTGLNGLSYAFILFLVAAGFSLTFGIMGFLNLSHGALYMLGAYVGFEVIAKLGPFWLSIVIAAVALAVVGLALYSLFLKQLHGNITAQCLLTTGIAMGVANSALWIWGPLARIVSTPQWLSGAFRVGSVTFPVYRLFIVGAGLVVLAILWWMQDRTRVGAIIRAGMDDKEMTVGLGVNYGLVSTLVFVFGIALAGIAGILANPILGAYPTMGDTLLLLAFLVVVVGGTGKIQGTMLGALVIGLLETFGQVYLPRAALYLSYIVFLVVLLVRPSGLVGRKVFSSDASVSGSAGPPPIRRVGNSSLETAVPAVAFGILLLVLPLFIPRFVQTLVVEVMILSVFSVSMNVLWGYAGMWTFGHAAFFGAGGYACAILLLHGVVSNFWLNLLLSVLITAALAAILGIPALRVFPVGAITNPVYFILTTLALGEILSRIAIAAYSVTRGSNGLAGVPYPAGMGFNITAGRFYYLVFVFAAISIYVMYRIVCSRYGYVLRGIQGNERRMQALGFNTWVYKYTAWIIAGAFAGVAGVLYAYWAGVLVPSNLGMNTSQIAYLAVVLGGMSVFFGPIIGTIIYVVLSYLASLYLPERWPLILGAAFVISILLMRQGVGVPLLKTWVWFARQGVGISLLKLWRRLSHGPV